MLSCRYSMALCCSSTSGFLKLLSLRSIWTGSSSSTPPSTQLKPHPETATYSPILFTILPNPIHYPPQSYSLPSPIIFTILPNSIHHTPQFYSLSSPFYSLSTPIQFIILPNFIHYPPQFYSLYFLILFTILTSSQKLKVFCCYWYLERN